MAGIDQILQNKISAGRQNPQALMQSYQQNQDLLDLLAMQKLKSEKEAAQRDMMLKAAQSGPPPTVVQQREQELVAMNKNEIAQQAAQVGQQQAAQQQAAMQSLLNSGIGQLPAPNMARMAGGGIVGYAPGGDVSNHGDGTPMTEEEISSILRNVDPDLIVGEYHGAPVRAADMARLLNAGAIDETPEGDDLRARYAGLQEAGQRGRADILGASRRPIEITPASDGTGGDARSGTGGRQPAPYNSGNYGLDEMLIDAGQKVKSGLSGLAGRLFPPMTDEEITGAIYERVPLTRVTPPEPDTQTQSPQVFAVEEPTQPSTGAGIAALPAAARGVQLAAPPVEESIAAMSPSGPKTPAEYLLSVAPTPERAAQMQKESAPAGLSALQEEIARAQGQRDDKLRYLADFLTGAGGATNMGAAMRGAVSSARESQTAQDQAIRNLIAEQQGVELKREETAARKEEAAADRELRDSIVNREIGSRRDLAEMDAELRRELATMDIDSRMAIEDLRLSRQMQAALAEALSGGMLSVSDVTSLTKSIEDRFMLMTPQLEQEFRQAQGLSDRDMQLASNKQALNRFIESRKAQAFRAMASGQSPYSAGDATIPPEIQEAMSLYPD
jgi:hypothetical protein